MAIFTFLLTMVVLGMASCAGYRLNMYLYARGALGAGPRREQPVEGKSRSVRRDHDASLIQVRDYGLGYARTGILIFAVLMSVIVISLIALISAVL